MNILQILLFTWVATETTKPVRSGTPTPVPPHVRDQQRKKLKLIMLAAATAVLTAAAIVLALRMGYEPAWGLIGVAGVAASLLAMRKWPLVIFAGLQFVGNFKTVPGQGFDLRDPTVLLLLLCLGAVVMRVLFAFSGIDDSSLADSLRGQTAVTVLFFMLLASIAISTFYTPAIARGTIRTLRFAVFESLSFFYPILFIKNRKDVRQLVLSFVLLGFALTAKVLWGLLHPSQMILDGDADITEIGDGMMLGIALLMATFAEIEISRAFKYFSVALLAFGLVACAARSPLVGLLITMIATAICAVGRTRRSARAATVLILIVAVPAFIWLQRLSDAQAKMEWKTAEFEAMLTGSTFSSGTIARRLSFYSSTLDALAEHPVGGVGIGGWSIFYDNADTPHHPHNFVLEVAAEEGLIGLTILLALLTLLFRKARSALRSDSYVAFVFPVFVSGVALNLMTGDIESRNLWFCFGLAAAAARLCTPLPRDEVVTSRIPHLVAA